jgi:hypothetical protein
MSLVASTNQTQVKQVPAMKGVFVLFLSVALAVH